ncbi:MAG: hypothetical protein DIU78_017930 [Pseudomonadota bacterium]
MGHAVFNAVVCALSLVVGAAAAYADEPEVFARVVVSETELRSGPGISHRVIERAKRGDTFLVETRETKGFWLEVTLADGRTAYVLGDTVERMTLADEPELAEQRPGVFAPPALATARGGFALLAGMHDGDGYAEVRPALVIAPSLSFEPYVGVALLPESRRLIYGAATALNFAPDWAIAPFVALGIGGVLEQPKDEFVMEERKWFHARAGGGLLVSLRLRLLFRLEASHLVLFTEDDYRSTQVYLGGLGTYF